MWIGVPSIPDDSTKGYLVSAIEGTATRKIGHPTTVERMEYCYYTGVNSPQRIAVTYAVCFNDAAGGVPSVEAWDTLASTSSFMGDKDTVDMLFGGLYLNGWVEAVWESDPAHFSSNIPYAHGCQEVATAAYSQSGGSRRAALPTGSSLYYTHHVVCAAVLGVLGFIQLPV